MKENYYQIPRMSEIEMYTEGILCGSDTDGQAPDLGKEGLGDIFC